MRHGKPIKIIIDTNLWISFLIGLKASSDLRNSLTDSSVTIVMTDILKSEIIKVASRPKFARHFASGATNRLVSFLDNRGEYYRLGDIPQRCRDPKDDYLLELAHISNADILITGDKDLLEMKTFGCCRIITLFEFKQL